MSARFDSEVMEHLEKLHRQHLTGESVRLPCAAARLSEGESVAFASPGQNPVAAFHEDLSALQSRYDSKDSDSRARLDDVPEDFANEKILQPRRLSLRVF
jgi:hypothetical protein